FDNNINSLLNILENIVENGIKYFVFSSSCTVYGNPDKLPVDENTPVKEAESPYGRTKQISEQIILDVLKNTETKSIMLRYFNPAGAHESTKLGESPSLPPLNLVPIITETAIGKRESMLVFGNDYNTRDGSAIRDYIHVMDLAEAHTNALQYLITNNEAPNYDTFNLGIGQGVTVLEAINAFEKVTKQKLNYKIAERRPGDVPAIYADYSKAKNLLNWHPKRNIEDIMRTAWEWEKVRSKKKR
ncbi:MAG TPA: UDP-glucose 4-epimerase GalE, partial [Bacteroidetes bacterium]|nr:UDP-glucose 4-epimerase GalE [Bacteroidota bacterium]